MGRIQERRIIVLLVLLLLTAVFVFTRSSNRTEGEKEPLRQAVSSVEGWNAGTFVTLDPEIVSTLELDNYVNQGFDNKHERITLFVGYYKTAKKVGASHSPLVCFPGQGWVVSNTGEKILSWKQGKIHLSSMVVSKGQHRELVLYWFQAYDRTSSGTFLQKVYLLMAKILKNREENAFVRVTVPMNGQSMEEALRAGEDFIESFYPVFLRWLKKNDT